MMAPFSTIDYGVLAPGRKPIILSEWLADQAVLALLNELNTWPKPGLISHVDSGSHTDMDATVMAASAKSLRPFFAELARAGQAGAELGRLRNIGLRAESSMLAVTGGINTHRGAIFGIGLLCAAAGAVVETSLKRSPVAAMQLGNVVRKLWSAQIAQSPMSRSSHGAMARQRYGVGGARAEAVSGFRSVYDIGWPALKKGRLLQPHDTNAARVHACFALIASVGDTNLLHRGGPKGMHYAAEAATAFLSNGGVGNPYWCARAASVHKAFVAKRLSPGGCADLLAMTLFIDAIENPKSSQ
jgi:triphosphoribosyl-dephospho-CoA synthase